MTKVSKDLACDADRIAFGKSYGFPASRLNIFERSGLFTHLVGYRYQLLQAYKLICQARPDDLKWQEEQFTLVESVYDASITKFKVIKFKVDYKLLILERPRTFSRLHREWLVSAPIDIPRYWFDRKTYSAEELSNYEILTDKLALEDSWNPGRYIVDCEFGRGSMFLKTSIEPQETKKGGGHRISIRVWRMCSCLQQTDRIILDYRSRSDMKNSASDQMEIVL